jgi:hypothetical protein
MRGERGGDEVSVASGGDGAVGGGGDGAVSGGGAVGGGSWLVVGEAARGEEDVILVGRRSSVGGAPADDGAATVHGRRGGAVAEDDGDPRGEGAGPLRTTAGRSWRSVGHSWRTAGWSEGRRRSGRTAALGRKFWQPDDVVSFHVKT